MSSLYDSYTNLVEIGRGGMATVYRATSKQTGQLVAIKVLDMHLMNDPAARARFSQEASFSLTHPNIVRVIEHDVDSRGSTPYIVMEYVAGESMEQELQREGKQPLQRVLPVFRDIANALDYAHGQGIVHRDVKPNNMLIRATTGQALLADFGIAKTASLTAYTQTMQRVGSVLFMSPEQAAGAPNLTAASDIYSLGVSTYYALSGRHPFEGEDQIAVARMHIDAAPPHLSDLDPQIPRAWGDAVMQTLSKVPSQRPHSASEFVHRLENALQLAPALLTPAKTTFNSSNANQASNASNAAGNVTPPTQLPFPPPLPRLPIINPANRPNQAAGQANGNAANAAARPAPGTPSAGTPPAGTPPAGTPPAAKPKTPPRLPNGRRLPIAALVLAGLIGILLCAMLSMFTGLFGPNGANNAGLPANGNTGSASSATTTAAVGTAAAAGTGTAEANGAAINATGTAQAAGATANGPANGTATGSPSAGATGTPGGAPATTSPMPAAPTRSGTIQPNQTPLVDFIESIGRPGAPTRAVGPTPTSAPPTQPPFVTVGPIGQPTLIVIGASPFPPTPLPPTPTSNPVIYPTAYPTAPPYRPPTVVYPTRTPFPPSPTPPPTATATALPTATATTPPTSTPTNVPTAIPPSPTPAPTNTALPTPEPPTVEPTITIVP